MVKNVSCAKVVQTVQAKLAFNYIFISNSGRKYQYTNVRSNLTIPRKFTDTFKILKNTKGEKSNFQVKEVFVGVFAFSSLFFLLSDFMPS